MMWISGKAGYPLFNDDALPDSPTYGLLSICYNFDMIVVELQINGME